jgi:rod shape-determining protein MreC
MAGYPPEFFNRGPSPLARMVFFGTIAIALMVADHRWRYLDAVRQAITVMVYPFEQAAMAPRRLAEKVSALLASQVQLQTENSTIKQQLLAQAERVQHFESLEAESATLRKLLGIRRQLPEATVTVEILHTGRSPLTKRVVVDKGAQDGIRPGQAVIDAVGIVGQVTAVYPFSSEVTLLTEKNQAIPVLNLRNGLRAVLFGTGREGLLDLPFIPINADVKPGDQLVTSGIDGTYPPGLAVATVSEVERNPAYVFARIACTPAAGVGSNKFMLVLVPDPSQNAPYAATSPPQEKATEAKPKSERGNRAGRRKREE